MSDKDTANQDTANQLPKEIQALQLGIKLALPPRPQPEVKGRLFNTGIRPHIDDWLIQESKKERDYQEYWSASSAGYCMRKLIFERLKVPKVKDKDDPRKQRVFTSGHLFHDWIQGITKAAGLSIAQELELQDEELMIRGHIDDLVIPRVRSEEDWEVARQKAKANLGEMVYVPTSNHLILYDYKTANSRSFDYKKEMSYYHKMQLATYMYMLRNMVSLNTEWEAAGGDIKSLIEARTLIIEKDTLRQKEFQLIWSDGLEKEIVNYWTTLNKYWKERKMPPCSCADHENGFLAKPQYNDYFYEGAPCSLDWLKLCKAKGLVK